MSHPSNDNPWQDERGQIPSQGQSQGYQNHDPYSTYQNQLHHPGGQTNPYAQQGDYAPPDHPPPGQQQQQRYYGSGTSAPQANEALHSNPTHSHSHSHSHDYSASDTNPWGSSTGTGTTTQPHQQQHQPSFPTTTQEDEYPPTLPPRRTATDLALPQGQDRSHQIEVMQSYESAGRKDEDDHNVEILQREFPKIDGSLIAAIYGDSKSLSATREMLGELET